MKSWLAAVTGFRREAKARKDANTRRPADGLPRPRRITAKGLSPRSFAAFCSSFMVAKGLDEITIGGLDQMMTRYATHLSGREWCWLVFALFHETAQHSVTSLIVKVEELLLADILSIRQMIRSPRPLEKLLDPSTSQSRLPSSQTLPAQVVLRDGAQIRLDDLNGPAVQSGTPQSATHEVMNGSVEGFDILVPGYGQCWAQRADVLAEVPRRDANDGNQWRLKTHSVTRLALSVNGSHVANRDRGIAALLRLIGTPITHLSLKSLADGVFDQSYLDLLWLCCPNLTYLHVSPITLGSLDDLIEAYAPGHCQVSSLCLGRCIVSDSDSVLSLARTLGDPLSPVANTMRELSLDFEEVRNPTTDEMLEAFLLVLEMNDRLLYLTLTVTDTQYDRFNERFLVFNGQYMRWKLPIQAKCAFLSVVKHAQRANAKTSGTKCRAVGNLDSLALSIILFMASERHLRSVILDSLT